MHTTRRRYVENNRLVIIVALIGLIGTLGAATLSNGIRCEGDSGPRGHINSSVGDPNVYGALRGIKVGCADPDTVVVGLSDQAVIHHTVDYSADVTDCAIPANRT